MDSEDFKYGRIIVLFMRARITLNPESCIIAGITASEGDYAKDYEDYSGHFEVSFVTVGPPTT
jgi:hypothetical protein